jgi:hypothetical protein
LHTWGSRTIRRAPPAIALTAGALLATVVVAMPAAPRRWEADARRRSRRSGPTPWADFAAPDYPLSNQNGPGNADPSDLENQPADARFVIDRVLASRSKRSGALSRLVDAKRIGASGHSLGALTTYRLVYQTCCRDKRIKAAASMSGLAGNSPDYSSGISTSLLAEHGDADGTLAYSAGADAFAKASPPKFLSHARWWSAHGAVPRWAGRAADRGRARYAGLLRPLPQERSGRARATLQEQAR